MPYEDTREASEERHKEMEKELEWLHRSTRPGANRDASIIYEKKCRAEKEKRRNEKV